MDSSWKPQLQYLLPLPAYSLLAFKLSFAVEMVENCGNPAAGESAFAVAVGIAERCLY